MNTDDQTKGGWLHRHRTIRLVVYVAAFALLMGMRPEFDSIWMRALVAGLAGSILALGVLPMGGRRDER